LEVGDIIAHRKFPNSGYQIVLRVNKAKKVWHREVWTKTLAPPHLEMRIAGNFISEWIVVSAASKKVE